MKAVGVKELKARLSEYVRLARTGEIILVKDRDEVVTELRPARRRAEPPSELEDLLDALAEAGELQRAASPKRGWSWRARGLGRPAGTAAAVLDEIRDERTDR